MRNASVCSGSVRLTLRKGSKTAAEGIAVVSKGCTYRTRITIRSTKKTGAGKGKLQVGARFGGNEFLKRSELNTSARFF